MSSALHADQRARARALDATDSFVVQAPAGSGKTELLIQRLLTVLAAADNPSEVLAITFTNKAAGEMRERLHSALVSATAPTKPDGTTLETQRRELALRVLESDRALGWRLLDGLNGVMIDTFDAFCARITASAPLLAVASSSALASVSESVGPLYRQAAQDALFDDDAEVVAASRTLLSLSANRVDDVIDLIANLLGRRSQWLGEAVDTTDAGVTNINDPSENIHGGTRYLRDLLTMFNGNVELALAGYNAGENAVIRAGNRIPNYPETMAYVPKVMNFYRTVDLSRF